MLDYMYVLIPFVFGVMAITIPQILIRENHPRLERRIIFIRRLGYGVIALIIVYGIVRYLA